MPAARPNGRGRLIAAIVVSVSLHGVIGLGWLNARTSPSAEGPGIDPTVDAPDDRDVAFVLREPRPDPTPMVIQPEVPPVPSTPATLPPTVVQSPATSHPGAVTPIGASPSPPRDLPKFSGARALHGRPKAGATVVYVVDRSASMGPNGLLGRAANAVRASLAELGPDVRFQIIAYNGGLTVFAGEPVLVTPGARERASDWLDRLAAEGRSDHLVGIKEALAARPTDVFLLTDADDLGDGEVRAIGALVRSPVRLMAAVVASRRAAPDTPLERLTTRLGGSVRYIDP